MPNDDQIDLNDLGEEPADENEMEGFHLIDEDEQEESDGPVLTKKKNDDDDDYDDGYRNDF